MLKYGTFAIFIAQFVTVLQIPLQYNHPPVRAVTTIHPKPFKDPRFDLLSARVILDRKVWHETR
jgi:hypothetical protein